MAIGDKLEEQRKAAEFLEKEGPVSMEEFRNQLDCTFEEFQTIIRGLQDNGVSEESRVECGDWMFDIKEGVDIEEIYSE